MATVVPIAELQLSPTAALFEGGDEINGSIFVTEYDRGQGPDLHFHPYPEAFVVQAGRAVFTAGDEKLTVEAGHIVVVPADTTHGFESDSDEKLRIVSFHPSPRVEQAYL
jgi:quercetin dioxygenase-like cupin family protein